MSDRRTDLPGGDETFSNLDKDRYRINELAEMLDAEVETVRGWLREEDIKPVSADYPDDYGIDAFEYLRMRNKPV